MTQSSSSSSSSSVVSTLAGMGLFLATAAVSQWIQNHHKLQQQQQAAAKKRQKSRRRSRRDVSRSSSCVDEDWFHYSSTEEYDGKPREKPISTEAFRRRRIMRRLSFNQFGDGTTTQPQQNEIATSNEWQHSRKSLDGEVHTRGNRVQAQPADSPDTFTEWSIHHSMNDLTSAQDIFPQETQTLKLEKETIRRGSFKAPIFNDRYHDFHPKYQNWRHFEHSNEHDRARQKRKSQLLKQKQQEERQKAEQIQRQLQLQHRPCRKQDAGEGASQNEDDEAKRQNFQPLGEISGTTSIRQMNERHPNRRSNIDNGSDEESIWTNDDDEESDNDKSKNGDSVSSSCASFGSGNQFVWTGSPISKNCRNESSKSIVSFGRNDDQDSNVLAKERTKSFRNMPNKRTSALRPSSQQLRDFSSNSNQQSLRNSVIKSSANTENSNRNTTHTSNGSNDNSMGKFEQFYRLLTSSVIDDDSDLIESSSSNINGISLASSLSNHSSTTNFDVDVEDRHRALRTEYNAQIMPEKLVLIRHGQSMGNVDETFYATTPDNAMPLTDLGWEQARNAGTILKDKIITPGESVHFIVSPYVRTVETFHGIVSAWCDPDGEEFVSIKDHNRKVNAWYERLTELGLTWNEDSRIREQDFGNYQTPEVMRHSKDERHRFGAFYYRFNNGESGSDVFDRVSTFLDSLWRSFETNKSQNYVLVTHGIVLRVLMARYFRYTISQLNILANPRNCEMVVLGHSGDGRLDLEGRCVLELDKDPETRRPRVKGYKFHKRLRILPKSHVRTVRFRISPRDHKKV